MIFVTGGTGFIGAHLLLELLQRDFPVRALRRKASSDDFFRQLASFRNISNEQLSRIEWVEGDLLDPEELTALLEGCSTVYHCAGLVSFEPSDWRLLKEINATGTSHIVNASLAAGVKSLIYVSSVAALQITELSKGKKPDWKSFRRDAPYGYSKYLGEIEVFRGGEEGLRVLVVNPGVVLGAAPASNPLSQIPFRLKKGLQYYPSGGSGYIAARDVARFTVDFALAPAISEKNLILVSEHHSFRAILDMFARELGVKPPLRPMTGLAAAALHFLAFAGRFTGIRPPLSSTSIRRLGTVTNFDNALLLNLKKGDFTPVKDAVKEAAGFYGA